MSLRQIAAATKISVSALDALEKNDLARLPGGIFSRAFVRAYASEIGIDPDQAIQDFIAQFPQESVTAGHPQAAPDDDFEAIESDRRTASTFLKLAAISVPIAVAVLYFGFSGRRKAAADVPARAPAQERDADRLPSVAAAVAVSGPTAAPVLSDGVARQLSIEIVAARACTITATVDGVTRPEQLLAAGERRTVDAAREIVLRVGDAAAVTWTVNGEAARPLGASGQPATVHLTSANYKDYVIPR